MSHGGDPQHSRPPSAARIQIDGGPMFEVAAGEDALLRAALRAGLAFPYECNVGGCGSCRFELLDGGVQTLWDAAPGLSDREKRRGKHLACQSRPVSDCRIKVRLDADAAPAPYRPSRFAGRLVARRAITPALHQFSFEVPTEQAQSFAPGQYALMQLPGVAGVRAYSMSNIANADGVWEFIVRRTPDGAGSGALFDRVAIGDTVTLDGPYGHAYLRDASADTPRELVCIAGGSGLGPMLSVARGWQQRRSVSPASQASRLWFFLGLRAQDELGAAAELHSLQGPDVSMHTVLSAPVAQSTEQPAWDGLTGFVHQALLPVLPQPLAAYDFYLAGPAPMVDAVQTLLMIEHQVPYQQIHFDRYV